MSVAVDIYAELNGAPLAANDNAVTANGNYRYDGNLKRVTGTEGLYEHADLRGSPRRLTDVSGSPDEKAFYSPFGMEYGNTNPLRSIKDSATGLAATVAFYGYIRSPRPNIRLRLPPTNYMQARYYDPVMGRFLSIDPVTFLDLPKPGQFNRYAYTWNDPINATDPTGKVIKILGSEDYKAKTLRNLTALKISNPKSSARIKALRDSKNIHVIRQPKTGESNNQNKTTLDPVSGRVNESNGVGIGSETLINDPTAGAVTRNQDGSSVNVSPESILGHEFLGHGGDKDNGVIDRSRNPATGEKKSEESAMEAGNEYRRAKGEKERDKH